MTLFMQAGRMQAYEPEDTPSPLCSGCNISDDGSSTTSTSSGTPAVNRHLKAPHLRPSPRGPLSSMDGLRPTDSFGSQLQDSDFAPGVPLKVWGNCMFDEEDAPSSPPLSPSSHTAAAMRHEDRPAAAALRCAASTSIKSMGRPAAAAAAAAAATAASSPRATESPASPAPAPSTSSSATAPWESRVRQMLACSSGSGATEDALRLAAPTGTLVRCRVVRSKGRMGSGYTYQMLLEDGDVPLLAAKRHAMGPGATYLIGAGIDAPRRESECMSKLKSNFMGTEFLLSGPSPSPSASPSSSSSSEELCIHFRATGLTTSGPRTMTAVLPTAPCASSCSCSSLDGSAGGLSSVMSMAKDRCLPASLEREVAIVCSKPPEFCETTQCHTLAFPGRKVTTSKKNHQLVCLDHRSNRVGSEVLLQLGKLAEEEAGGCDAYALDFAYPLNAHTAFAVALANLDDKLCFKV